MKVLVTEKISEEGIDILNSCAEVDVKLGLKPEELASVICDYEALVVRSQTKVTPEIVQAGKKLRVIARAGIGIDNVNVDEATRCGIVVVNAPTGNTISAAEHTMALMLSLARHIPQANSSLKSGQWRRNDFMGTELRNNTLGIVGLGSVGSEVARRARGMEMRLIGYDPFVSLESARNLKVELYAMEQLLKEADFITLHLPLTDTTRNLIGEKELRLVKPDVRIINCARGGLIDERALVEAVSEKRVAGAAVDVFPKEPVTDSILFESDRIIVTPHLGASTAEAQVTVSQDVAMQIADVFHGKPARYSVNAPFISADMLSILAPFIKAVHTMGRVVSQLAEGQMNTIKIYYEGDIADYETNPLKASVLGGILEEISEERVNVVNANIVAAERGLTVVEQKESSCENYSSLLTIEATTSKGTIAVAGTVMRGELHIVRVNEYWFDIAPAGGYFLFSDHLDRPGLISAVSRVTGDADVDISSMHVGRLRPRGQALMILSLDEPLSEDQIGKILAIPDVYSAKLVKI